MAVAFDASSESHGASTGSTSEASFTWNHVGAASGVKGILVFTFVNANADNATSVTYDGVNVPAVSSGRAVDTATEAGDCKAWFLGTGVSQGTKAVVVNRTNNANVMYAVAITVLAASNTAVAANPVLLNDNQALAEQSVNDGSPGPNSMRFAGVNSGLGTHPAAGASSTELQFFPATAGARSISTVRETTAGAGSRNVGFSATTDDVAAVHLAVTELPLSVGPLTENLKISATGKVDILGLGAWLKVDDRKELAVAIGLGTALFHQENLEISDTVTAALSGGDLSASGFDENLKVADSTPTLLLNPEQTTPTENLKISDSVTTTLDPLQTSTPAESMKISDTVTPALQLAVAPTSESLKISDSTSQLENPLQANPSAENLKISDVLTQPVLVTSGGDLSANGVASGFNESLKISDAVTVLLNPLQTTPSENLKISASGFIEIRGLGAWIKISDTVTASIFNGLQVQITPNESLKISESLSLSLNPLQTSGFDENLHVTDGGFVELVFEESLKISDSVQATRTGGSGDLSADGTASSFNESLKISESLTLRLDPEQTSTASEALKISDTVTPSLTPEQAAPATENLKISDVVTVLLNPLQTSGFNESLKVQDQPPIAAPPGAINTSESVKVSDSVTVTLDPLQASPATEALKIADTATPAIFLATSTPSEALKISDSVTARIGLTVSLAESILISDQVTAQLSGLLVVVPSEGLKIGESLAFSTGAPVTPAYVVDFIIVPATGGDPAASSTGWMVIV